MLQADVIIIGAGAAGLMAANELSAAGKKVIVLEGRDRIGGRILTLNHGFPQPVECGAEFIHGDLALTKKLLKEAGIEYQPSEGSFWHFKNGQLQQQEDQVEGDDLFLQKLKKLEVDTTVGAFLDEHFSEKKYSDIKKSVTSYVNGYYAADLYKASALALREELQKKEEQQYHIDGGYLQLMEYLCKKSLAQNCTFQFSTIAKNISWQKGLATVTTENNEIYSAPQIIITVPLGVLTANNTKAALQFQPGIAAVEAAHQLGFGNVIKILLQCNQPIWQVDSNMENALFLFSEEEVSTWWTQHPTPSNLLTGWCAGPAADKLKDFTEEQIFEKAVASLTHILSTTNQKIKDSIITWRVCNWATDEFTQGGYTYITTHTDRVAKMLNEPVEDTIYFAGEALHNGPEVGTVEAALLSGKAAAKRVLKMLGRSEK